MFSPRYWTFFIIVAAAIAYSMIRFSHQQDEMTVSPADTFSYRNITLGNGLRVVLVNTPDSEKAAAAVTVDVGSGDDPKDRQGLAHFLEHMLFLGTKPYPQPGEYQAYISRHGGSHNAFTAHTQTTYFFEIDNKALEGALDRFAPFFISPTFDEAYVDREKNAVHAEYSSKLRDDFRRIYSAEKMAMNPDHPFAHFATGNLDTLSDRPGDKVRDDLLEFYRKHYSAERMNAVIAGNYPLDELEKWARGHFADVPVHKTEPRTKNPPLFKPGQLPMDMDIEPVKEIRRLQFTFALPETRTVYQYKPVQVISSLIGHEGEGSLLAFLKNKGWAEALSAGRSLGTESETTLVVQIRLTKPGLLHIDNITQALMHYIDLIKAKPLPDYIFTEQQQLSQLAFQFQEHGRLSDYVVRLSSNMQAYPAADTIYGDYRWVPAPQSVMQPYLDALGPDKMLRTLIAPKVATDMTDPWYGTPLRIRPSDYNPASVNTEGLEQLSLPTANPFIPTDFELHAGEPQQTPERIIDEPDRRLWYYPEHEFEQPKSRVILQIQQARVQNSARERVLAQLYTRTVKESLNTYSYPASMAGLDYNLSATGRGLQLMLGGYQHKMPELLDRILAEMDSISLEEENFEQYKASLQRNLANQLKNKPYERGLDVLKLWLHKPSFDPSDLLAALEDVSRDDVLAYAAGVHSDLATEMYIHGTMSKKQAMHMADIVNQHFPASAEFLQRSAIVKLPEGQYQQSLTLDHQDNAAILYIQGQDTSDANRARYSLLGQILSSPYYQRIRTELQMGYVVFATPYPQRDVPALAFIVQSPKSAPQEILDQSLKFFTDYQQTLNAMSDEEFANYRQGLITLLTEKPKNMNEKAVRFWRDIDSERWTFDTTDAIAAEVEKLTKEDISGLYSTAVLNKENPWLIITQGGAISGWPQLDSVARDSQPEF